MTIGFFSPGFIIGQRATLPFSLTANSLPANVRALGILLCVLVWGGPFLVLGQEQGVAKSRLYLT